MAISGEGGGVGEETALGVALVFTAGGLDLGLAFKVMGDAPELD